MATETYPEPQIETEAERASPQLRSSGLLLAAFAGLCWAGALALLFLGGVVPHSDPLAPMRVLFYILIVLAGLLTFLPAERRLGLPGLAFEGIAGSFLLLYTIAFVPPPTGWLLSPPDAPVYLILAAGVFWCCSALVMPLVYAAGRRLFHQRARRYDLRRARRQAHEIGALAALSVGLAGLRVLTPVGVILLALILVVAEFLFLSFVETMGKRD